MYVYEVRYFLGNAPKEFARLSILDNDEKYSLVPSYSNSLLLFLLTNAYLILIVLVVLLLLVSLKLKKYFSTYEVLINDVA